MFKLISLYHEKNVDLYTLDVKYRTEQKMLSQHRMHK